MATTVTIFGKAVAVNFFTDVVDETRQQSATTALQAMADSLAGESAAGLSAVASLIDGVMFFEANIPNGPYTMDRSFTDLPARQFNWKLSEFLDPNHTPCSRASYYYHDAFHVGQFSAAGAYPSDLPSQVQWEVDAINAQIGAVRTLGCGQYLVDFLSDFDHSAPQITARLEAGVAAGCGKPGSAPPVAV